MAASGGFCGAAGRTAVVLDDLHLPPEHRPRPPPSAWPRWRAGAGGGCAGSKHQAPEGKGV